MKKIAILFTLLAGCGPGLNGNECHRDLTCDPGLVCLVYREAAFDKTVCTRLNYIRVYEKQSVVEHQLVPVK